MGVRRRSGIVFAVAAVEQDDAEASNWAALWFTSGSPRIDIEGQAVLTRCRRLPMGSGTLDRFECGLVDMVAAETASLGLDGLQRYLGFWGTQACQIAVAGHRS